MPLASGWSSKQAKQRSSGLGDEPSNHAARQSGAAKNSAIRTSYDKPRWDGRVRQNRVALSSSTFNAGSSQIKKVDADLEAIVAAQVTPNNSHRKQGTQQNSPSSESRTLEEKRQTLKAKQAELAALENELLAQRSRTSAETPVSTARCEEATPGESAAVPQVEMVQDTLVDSDAVRCPSLGTSREEEMAAWRTASGSGIAAAAGRPSDASTSGRPSDASIVGRPSDTGLQGPSNEASRLRARNKELEEVSIMSGREIRSLAEKVSGLEEKLEAALGQLQRRTQQLADAERRNRSLQDDCRIARDQHARVVQTLELQERQLARAAAWAASPAATQRSAATPAATPLAGVEAVEVRPEGADPGSEAGTLSPEFGDDFFRDAALGRVLAPASPAPALDLGADAAATNPAAGGEAQAAGGEDAVLGATAAQPAPETPQIEAPSGVLSPAAPAAAAEKPEVSPSASIFSATETPSRFRAEDWQGSACLSLMGSTATCARAKFPAGVFLAERHNPDFGWDAEEEVRRRAAPLGGLLDALLPWPRA